jgi:hypothetical protein
MSRMPLFLVLTVISCTRAETGRIPPPAPVNTTAAVEKAPPAPVRTDRSAYVLTNGPQGPEATIVTTLRAPDDRAIHLLNCNGATGANLQRKVRDEWVYAWAVMMNACMSAPIVVPPGGEHTASIYLHENSGGVVYPERARMIETGTYRVVWTGVLETFDPDVRGFGTELPLEQRVSAPITIEVPPLTVLTAAEAERLVRLLADAINEPSRDSRELVPYVLHGPEALRAGLLQYRIDLGRVTRVRHVKEFIFELEGTKGKSLVEAHREDRVRIHSPLLDYGFRAERFMKAYLEAIATGDAERLARVLNPDDVDFPVPRAQQMIDDYRRRYRDVRAIRAEFVGLDEEKNVLRWRVTGPGPEGQVLTEPIDLGFGDGLIGIRGL